MTDASVAAALARGAGELLLKIRGSSGLAGQALKDEGDKRSHELLVAELARVRPDDAVRSEEAGDGPERVRARRVWIIDPLDG
ncbi:MAG: inositol monophosphatase family protein, partial [Kineosporiaceae bacterium]